MSEFKNPQDESDKYCENGSHLWIQTTPIEEGEKSIIICMNCRLRMSEYRKMKNK